MRDDMGHVPSPILEGEPPRQSDEVHEDHAQGGIDFYPPIPVEGLTPNILPQPNLPAQPIFLSTEGPPPAAEERRKLDLIEERLRAVEGFGDYSFADMADLCLVPDVVIPQNSRYLILTSTKGRLVLRTISRCIVAKWGQSRDEKLLMHFFQDSLAGAAVIWYTNLEASRILTWKDLIIAFLRQYQYNSDMAPDRTQLQNMVKKENETFKEYAQRWRDL